ncbi:hypothetical protein [Desulfatiferula olefinivorans]
MDYSGEPFQARLFGGGFRSAIVAVGTSRHASDLLQKRSVPVPMVIVAGMARRFQGVTGLIAHGLAAL